LSKKIKDTDYLYVTAFIWGHEPKLLSRDKVDRMLEARSFDMWQRFSRNAVTAICPI